MAEEDDQTNSRVMEEVSAYISKSGEACLPPEVVSKAKHHILDTLAAMVSGSTLKPGQLAKRHAKNHAGVREALVVASQITTSAIDAAFANGMMAHADETDDFNPRAKMHAGVAIVPAALAMAEREGADGMGFLKAVVAGCDIGGRVNRVLGSKEELRGVARCSNGMGGNFGAATAAASVLRLADEEVRYVLSFAAEQASGVTFWMSDQEHALKACVYGGMPARNGVTSAILVQSGFTGVLDPFCGQNNFFKAYSATPNPRRELLIEGLGREYEIMYGCIKQFSVGSPIQGPLNALLLLMEKHGLRAKDVDRLVATTYGEGAKVVDNREMPDINLQHILALTLVDGGLTFESSHSFERMSDPSVLSVKKRITLVGDPGFGTTKRQGIVEITTKDGARLREHVVSPRGMMENPMTTEEVEKKCRELLEPVLGQEQTHELIDRVWNLEKVGNMRTLRSLLSA